MVPRASLLTFIAIVGLSPSWASAAEVAEARGESTSTRSSVDGLLRSSDAAKLFRGEIPRLDHLDEKYGRHSRAICRYGWAKLRAKRIDPVPVAANLGTIRANAKKLKLSLGKVDRALGVFLKNQGALPNQRYVSIIDYDQRASEKRLYTIDLRTGKIDRFHVAAGLGSDPGHTGFATKFSNHDGSLASSLGCYVAYGKYHGAFGRSSLMLHGFEKTNDNACNRAVVMHPASYVDRGGRSWGCPAVDDEDVPTVFGRVGGGGLICAYRDGVVEKAPDHFVGRGHHRGLRRRAQHHRRSRSIYGRSY